MGVVTPGSSSPARLTIGFLTTSIGDGNARALWSGIVEGAQQQGINLLSFVGREINNPELFHAQANIVYELANASQLHGLIIWASSISAFIIPAATQVFCERYHPLPMVTIGMPVEHIPSIILDSYQGMREAVLHLVQVHGRRRLAFIRGPVHHREAHDRYRAYLDVLKECHLEDDPALVIPPHNWSTAYGNEAARILVEERKVQFDAIVGVNDQLAVGAMEYLLARGVDIPGDISVMGFDNTLQGKVNTPPMSTVPIRMRERGRKAVQLLMAQIAGEPVPELVTLPTTLRLRRSCGCPDPIVAEAGLPEPWIRPGRPSEVNSPLGEFTAAVRAEIITAMEHVLDLEEAPPAWAAELLDAFLFKLESGNSGTFPFTLEHILRRFSPLGRDLIAWQKVITMLRTQTLPRLRSNPEQLERAERYLHQARVMVSETALRAQGYLDFNSSQEMNDLHRIRQSVSATQSLGELMEMLARELPLLGINRCYLSLYENPAQPVKSARLALAYDQHGRCAAQEGTSFEPAWRLAPDGLLAADTPYNLAVHPLYFGEEPLGFVLLDATTFQGAAHQVLCEQISSAIKSARLLEQNIQLYHQALEGQQLAEEANLLKSRFLSMVSHELLTPMVLLVGLSEMMLREGIGDRPPLPEAYRQDLTRMHAGAQQLGSLVRDVLDLARSQLGQLKLARKPVHLCEVLKPVILVGEQMARSKGLVWRTEIPENLPLIMGDSARLQQVTLNLVSNAIKFTAQGEIALVVQVEQSSATVSICDSGLGVPLGEQVAIFDEFRQSERTVTRGYGGLGIGLAICRQLIELHDGKIGVHSSGDENGGSTFYFSIPVLVESTVTPPVAPSDIVLVLTSQVDQAARLRDHLLHEGFQVRIQGIEDHPEWLAQVLAAPPGAVVLDVPASDQGWELMELLKGSPATQDIPVIFYSLLQEQSCGSILSLDYLAKPVAGAALSHALDRYGLSGGDCNDPRTVLVADDDPAILDMHARLIGEHIPGCRVMRAGNGRMALELMRQRTPSLVLLDLMMPELDGTGVLKQMQEDERLRDVPVIVLTAQTLTQDEMSHLNRGVAAVLSKGVFTADETLAHIEQALSRSKRLGSEPQRLVRKVMAYIHEHYAEPVSRDQLATYAGVSDRHLNRCFMQETGLAPGAYLNRYRIQQARSLLKENYCNITEVMGMVGFSDSSYFTRVFRREVGMTPSEFQRGEVKSPLFSS